MGFFGRKRAPSVPHPRKEPRFDGPLTLKRLEQIFQDCVDFTKRPVSLGEGGACTLTLCYLSGMVKMERVSDYVLRPLAQDEALARCGTPRQAMDRMKDGALYNLSAEERTRLDAAVFDFGERLLSAPLSWGILGALPQRGHRGKALHQLSQQRDGAQGLPGRLCGEPAHQYQHRPPPPEGP